MPSPVPNIDLDLFTINESSNNTINIVDYDSDTSGGLSYDFPYGTTATLEWPNLEVSGTETTLGTYTGDGASNNALVINLDIDQAAADIFLGGVNPLDPPPIDLVVAGADIDLIDIDNIDERLAQNKMQETLNQAWLDYLFDGHDVERV